MNELFECLGGKSSGCIAQSIEDALNAADKMAEKTTERYTHEEVFAKWREVMQGKGGALNCRKLSFPMV